MKELSAFERNMRSQPELLRALLRAPLAALPRPASGGRLMLVGTGSNLHVAQLARWLWARHGRGEAQAWAGFEFARLPARPRRGDVVIVLSHRGTKTYSLQAAELALEAGARLVLVTGRGSPAPRGALVVETCSAEETGAYTKSVTTTLACLCRWIGSGALLSAVEAAAPRLRAGPPLPEVKEGLDLVLVGDGPREWVARETALKLFETCQAPARPFGLEEFLHGPRLSLSRRSLVVGFSSAEEPRWGAARAYLRAVGVRFLDVSAADSPASWLPQLYWGQRLSLAAARALGRDPDSLRTDDPRWRRAREALSL